MKKIFLLLILSFLINPYNLFSLDKNDYYNKFNKIKKTENWLEGEKVFKKAVKEYPEELNFHTFLNYFLRNQKKYEEALKLIEKVYLKNKSDENVKNHYLWTLHGLGWKVREEGKKEEALSIFKKSYELAPDDQWSINGYGVLLRETEQFEKAIKLLKDGMKKFPENNYLKDNYMYCLMGLAWKKNDEGKKEEAYKLFKESYEMNPDNEWNINAYGYILREKELIDDSIKILEYGHKKYPENNYIRDGLIYSYLNKTTKYKKEEKYDLCEKLYLKVKKLNPDNESFMYNYGDYLRITGAYKEALSLYNRGKKLYPESIYFDSNIIHVYYNYSEDEKNKGNLQKALKILLEANSLYPEEFWFHYYISSYYEKLNDYENSAEFLIKLAALGYKRLNTDAEIEDYQISVYHHLNLLVSRFSNIEEYDKAFKMIDDIEKYFPKKYYIYQAKGVLTYHSGEKDKGLDLTYEAYDDYIKYYPEYKKSLMMPIPLKGIFMVGGNSRRNAITHAGMNKYCYDFWGSNEKREFKKRNTNGFGNNEDYIGFGLPIYSPIDGVIEEVIDDYKDLKPSDTYRLIDGNYISIKDKNGYHYVFVHNKFRSAKVKVGDNVKKGQMIGEIGNTGMTTIAHLHFGVYSEDWMVSIPVQFSDYYLLEDGDKKKINKDFPEDMELIQNEGF